MQLDGREVLMPRGRAGGDGDAALRDHLVYLLNGGGAHVHFDEATRGIPVALRGKAPRGLPYSPWQLLEHLRLAQWDIVEFSRDAAHVSPDWPDGYWPESAAPPTEVAWRKTVGAFRRDLQTMVDIVRNPATDLYARIPWGDGQTVLREALLVADHNAYHLGELMVVRRLLGAWK
jgi:hypothetical protein